MQEQIQLKEIEANPYRALESYPIRKEKVLHLRESVRTTGLWPRLMGRRRKGKIQLAYGHHLWQALLEEYGPNHKILIEVRDIADSEMFQMMARENMSDWDATPIQNLLTVKELLAAMSRGEIELPQGKLTSSVKLFAERKTTGEVINKFLGWTTGGRLTWITEALELMDLKLLRLKELEDLTEKEIIGLTAEIFRRRKTAEREAREAEEWAEQAKREEQEATSEAEKRDAKKTHDHAKQQAQVHREYAKTATRTIITEVGAELRANRLGAQQVRAKASDVVPPPFAKKKDLPPINQFAHTLAAELNRVLGQNDPHRAKLQEIADHEKHLDPFAREILLGALHRLSKSVEHWISRLDPKQNNGQRAPVKSAGPKRIAK